MIAFTGTLFLIFCLLSALALWLMPQPHGALQYMVAGALATAISLAAGFAAIQWLPNNARSFVPVIRIRIARR